MQLPRNDAVVIDVRTLRRENEHIATLGEWSHVYSYSLICKSLYQLVYWGRIARVLCLVRLYLCICLRINTGEWKTLMALSKLLCQFNVASERSPFFVRFLSCLFYWLQWWSF